MLWMPAWIGFELATSGSREIERKETKPNVILQNVNNNDMSWTFFTGKTLQYFYVVHISRDSIIRNRNKSVNGKRVNHMAIGCNAHTIITDYDHVVPSVNCDLPLLNRRYQAGYSLPYFKFRCYTYSPISFARRAWNYDRHWLTKFPPPFDPVSIYGGDGT